MITELLTHPVVLVALLWYGSFTGLGRYRPIVAPL